jgi:hypothetical protein
MKHLAFLLLFSAQFWETKPPADWSEAELNKLLTDSPWAQMVAAPGSSSATPVQVFIATANPIEQAELEWDRRHTKKKSEPDTMKEEYRAWLKENRAGQIILAIAVRNVNAFSEGQESKTMENESVMVIGRKKYKMTGYFPPSAGDPYLRLAFPREVKPSDKRVTFDLYIPGIGIGYRSAEFSVKDMIVNGKLEM